MDDTPVTFGMRDARRIDRSVMFTEHYVEGRRTPAKQRAFVGGDGGTTIMFELVTVDCIDHVATATVIGYTCGAGSPAIGSTVELCDAMRCFLVGSPAVLPGRVGLAQQMTLDPSVACSAVYDSDPCPWVITWLVPADFSCT